MMPSNHEESKATDSEDDRKPAALPSHRQRKQWQHQSQDGSKKGSFLDPPSANAVAATANRKRPTFDSSDDGLLASLSNCEKASEGSKNAAVKITKESPEDTANTNAVARNRKSPPTAIDSDVDPHVYLKGEGETPKISTRMKEKATVVGTNNDCKPAALPTSPPTTPSKCRYQPGVDNVTDSKRRQTNQDIQNLNLNIPSLSSSPQRKLDYQLASTIQEQEYQLKKADAEKEHEAMTKSPYGKAVLVVQEILELTKNTKDQAKNEYPNFAQNFDSVSTDDMVFLAKNLLEKQREFLASGILGFVDIGYHYTDSTNLNSIRTNGLMTRNERDSQGIQAHRFHGSTYGDGVYTGNSPTKFAGYGNTGLIVGRLLGTMKTFGQQTTDGANTVLVPDREIVVLKTSAQCLPMIKYDMGLVGSQEGQDFIQRLTRSLQAILDQVFNPGLTGAPLTCYRYTDPSSTNFPGPIHYGPRKQGLFQYIAPERLAGTVNPNEAFCLPPSSCNFQIDCAICHDALSDPRSCVAVKVCNHVFHKDCIEQACKSGSKCPTCRKCIGTPLGKSPSGSMSIMIPPVFNGMKCSGFANCDTIVIAYSIRAGIQKHYHENPGQSHSGKYVTAYLPNNSDGQSLLKRLKFAFLHGLTFTIGTSITTGATNQCIWSSIHHKTSPNSGVHGFPDPNYFANCNGELDSENVPAANLLDVNGTKKQTVLGGIPPIAQPFGVGVGRAFGTGSASTTISSSAIPHRYGATVRLNPQNGTMQQAVVGYIAPERLSGAVNPNEAFCLPPSSCNFQSDCVICHDALSDPSCCVALKVCNHVFHKDCIEQACKFGSKCPTCRKCIGTPLGKSPSGSMSISITYNLKCSGFAAWDTIVIVYSMQAGTQKHYHENPGQPHPDKHATAYLPNNPDGRNLLKRLKFAFLHGLTFTIVQCMDFLIPITLPIAMES
ncbi:unnamed protein product [Cylindrotheca closterium]|uniref:RING-type E3 ubiquitin transferase n=1 Tax=Cylindrotheca closterium TaxID=2856 RepID=A0AAD2GDL2_9STRA|nr:unnamed protein product [Cylindrotheca closterium]